MNISCRSAVVKFFRLLYIWTSLPTSFLNVRFSRYRTLGWQVPPSPFETFKDVSHLSSCSLVSHEISDVIIIFVSLGVVFYTSFLRVHWATCNREFTIFNTFQRLWPLFFQTFICPTSLWGLINISLVKVSYFSLLGSFFQSLFSLCFTLNSFYCYVKFTTVFFCRTHCLLLRSLKKKTPYFPCLYLICLISSLFFFKTYEIVINVLMCLLTHFIVISGLVSIDGFFSSLRVVYYCFGCLFFFF